jgi:hypothetical protein
LSEVDKLDKTVEMPLAEMQKIGWQTWWALSDIQREHVEQVLNHIVWHKYQGDMSQVRSFIDLMLPLRSLPEVNAIITILEDMIA